MSRSFWFDRYTAMYQELDTFEIVFYISMPPRGASLKAQWDELRASLVS